MKSVDRILLSRLKYIGDIVLTTPVIRSVREQYPGAFIAYLGDAQGVSLLLNNPHLDAIIPFDFRKPVILEQPRVAFLLRRHRFDAAVDFYSNPRSALLTYLTGAPMRIGLDARGRGSLYTHRVSHDGQRRTAIEFHYRTIEPLGVLPAHHRTEIFLADNERREARELLARVGLDPDTPTVGFHPGATWPAKRWPEEYFAEAGRLTVHNLGAQVLLTQGPGDGPCIERIVRMSGNCLTVVPLSTLRQLAAVLSHLILYVSNDAAPMHIAAAVGTPTIGIFGPGEEDIWFPYDRSRNPGSSHIALRKNVPCHPCHLDVCNRTGDGYMECMRLLTPGDVITEIGRHLNTLRS